MHKSKWVYFIVFLLISMTNQPFTNEFEDLIHKSSNNSSTKNTISWNGIINLDTDYTVSGNTITVVSSRTISDSDRLDVMYFAVETAHGPTGFRIFKDMLNRTHYKRISKVHTTKLSNDITPESKNIQVVDGSILAVPNAFL